MTTDSRSFFDRTINDNREHLDAMLELIASRQAIAFVGAGLSANPLLRYPSWLQLIETLREAAAYRGEFSFSRHANGNYLLMAEEIRCHFSNDDRGDEYMNILGREFGPRSTSNSSQTHDSLVKLPFKAYVTTNYDDCLTTALHDARTNSGLKHLPGIYSDIKLNGDSRHTLSKFLRSLSEPFASAQPHVVHIHGRHDDPRNIILTFSDYYKAYGFKTEAGRVTQDAPCATLHKQLAWALLATHKLVFFGCSMDDPYVCEMLKIVAKDLWEYDRPIHYVVLPLDASSLSQADVNIRSFKRFGLQTVFYDNWDGSFMKLNDLLDLAYHHSASGEIPKERDSTNFATNTTHKVSSSPTTSADWLDDINEVTLKDLRKDEN